jgi:hypothetical protein
MAWFLSLLYLRGLYPNWDDDVAKKMGLFIQGALICAWSIFVIWLLSGRGSRLYSWFRVGVWFAFILGVVRVFFMREVIRILNL